MHKVIVQSESFEDVQKIRSQLTDNLPFEVVGSVTPKGTQRVLTTSLVQLTILDVTQVSKKEMMLINQFRNIGYGNPILFLAPKIEAPQVRTWINRNKVFHLKKPFSEMALLGITKKLVLSKTLAPQKFVRYQTQQESVLESFLTGESISTKIFNLSRGGGYCECTRHPSLNSGDLIRVTVPLKEISKDHSLNARVVWTTDEGSYSGKPGIGFRFVNDTEVFNGLIAGI